MTGLDEIQAGESTTPYLHRMNGATVSPGLSKLLIAPNRLEFYPP
jgi:hypothetical protein